MKIGEYETHEFADMFPMIEHEELEKLKDDIREHGLLQPIILHEDKILDGRNRYTACVELGLEPKFEDYSGSKAFEYVVSTNLHRRHLTASQKAVVALDILPHYEKLAKERHANAVSESNKIRNDENSYVENFPHMEKEAKRSSEEVGKIVGVNNRYIVDIKKIKETKPEVIEEIRTGFKTIQDVKKDIRKEKIQKQREEIETNVSKNTVSGEYDVIVIDPPWDYENANNYDDLAFRGTTPYPTMTLEEIKAIDLPAKENCVLWLWTTNKFLLDMKPLLEEWGFELKTILTWDKEHIAVGKWLRSQTEHCILAVKGKPFYNNTKWGTLIREKRTTHSEKPDIFYKLVEEVTAGRRLDFFARKPREGWDVYGDEV